MTLIPTNQLNYSTNVALHIMSCCFEKRLLQTQINMPRVEETLCYEKLRIFPYLIISESLKSLTQGCAAHCSCSNAT